MIMDLIFKNIGKIFLLYMLLAILDLINHAWKIEKQTLKGLFFKILWCFR